MKKLNIFKIAAFVAVTTTGAFAQSISTGVGVLSNNSPTSNMNVGIGTITPTAALHIFTGSNPGQLPSKFILERNDGTNQAGVFSLGISGSVWPTFASTIGAGSACFKLEDPFGNSQNSDMVFSTNAISPQFIIKHNGNVGIGTTSPSANFHSVGTARLETLPSSSTNTDIITADANGNLATRSAASLFSSSGWNLNGNTTLSTDFIGTLTANPFNIYTNNIQRAIITPTGEMGIGTTTPTAQLEVNSAPTSVQTGIKARGINTGVFGEATDMNVGLTAEGILAGWTEAIGVFGKGTYASNVGNGNIMGVAGSATANNPLNNVGVYGEAKNAVGYNTGVFGAVNSTTGIYNTGIAGSVALNTSAIWNIAVSGKAPVAPNHFAGYFDGNVDIKSGVVTIGNGTLCTPTGYKLFVEEGILTEKVKVAVNCSTAWADYVFANDYKLKPLSEVEAYVKENKHLPNIPSASELVNDGLNLGEMQAKQMEKIEELTLYMIEMKKEIDTLKKENEILKSKN